MEYNYMYEYIRPYVYERHGRMSLHYKSKNK